MAYRALLKPLRPGTRLASLWGGRALSDHRFKPEKVAVVTKTTRYEFELQRYRYAGLSEDDLKQLVCNISMINTILVSINSFFY